MKNEKFIESATGGFNVNLTPLMVKTLHWVAIYGRIADKTVPEPKEVTELVNRLHGIGSHKPDRFVASVKALEERGLLVWVDCTNKGLRKFYGGRCYVLTEEGWIVHQLLIRAGIVSGEVFKVPDGEEVYGRMYEPPAKEAS